MATTARGGPGWRLRALLVAVPLAAALVAACASGTAHTATNTSSSTASTSAGTKTKAKAEDIDMTAGDFVSLKDMTPVRGFFIANRLGHLKEALAVADDPKGGVYPVGTVIQLIPQEAMVKRHPGFRPATDDWEFFSLGVSPAGTTIRSRGGAEVVNRFGGSCADCHKAAASKFDFVCEHDHGCAPLPIGDDVIAGVQKADPRPA